MTSTSSTAAARRFYPLEQADFLKLEQAASLKGLLQPFKGKGSLETWASQCAALRDDVIGLAQRCVLPQARAYPFSLLHVQLAQQATGAGTTFLRWRKCARRCANVCALRRCSMPRGSRAIWKPFIAMRGASGAPDPWHQANHAEGLAVGIAAAGRRSARRRRHCRAADRAGNHAPAWPGAAGGA